MDESSEKVVLREGEIQRALTRIAHEIAERNSEQSDLAIVGIHRRGSGFPGASGDDSARGARR